MIMLCDHSLFTPIGISMDFRGREEQEIVVQFYVGKTNLERKQMNII